MRGMRLEHLDGAATLGRLEEIQSVYAAAFPGYSLADHETRTRAQASRSGFKAVTATDSGRMAGMAYGLPLAEGSSWWADLDPPRAEEFITETGRRTFAVIDLAVLPSHRGKGLGRRLMDELLAGRQEERATLATAPHETGVQAMYERWGWSKAGRVPGNEGETEAWFDLYMISLRGPEASSSR
jgi:ribosomal protein S18 acetylase RimI-like enzyme